MKKKVTKKAISMALAAAMAFSQVQVFAASSDIKGHWAESTITSWQDKALISGYTDGTFKPDNSITRAEFASMVNKALGLTEKGEVPFSDVQSGSWYYDAISIAVKAGYCSGYEDGTFKPDATITRAEAAVMIALAKGLTQNTAAASGFADTANIPAWAKGYVGAVVSAGYMSGRPDGTFDATNTITRAEAVSSLDRAMGNTATTDKDIVVTEDDTVIDGQTIEGNLIIDKAVGEGEVYVKNTTVAGNIIVQGGGDDSVYLENVTAKGKVIVEKSGVRVQFEGTTEVSYVEVKAVCELKGRNFEGTVGTITIAEELGTSEAVKINVPAEAVVISAKASVYVNAKVDKLTVASAAKGSKVEVTSGTTVGTLVADAEVAISGSGKVEKLEANADGITVSSSTTVTETEVAEGVEKPSTPSTGGGGGGGSSSSSTTSKTKTVDVTSAMIAEKTNLQNIITENEKTKTNLTLNVPSNIAETYLTDTLTYTGNGKLTINVTAAETAQTTLAAAGKVTINAANATGVTITGKDFELTSLEFNAPKASINTDVKATKVVLTDVATATIDNASTTDITVTKAASVSVPNGQKTTVTVSDSTAINGNVSKVVASGDESDIVTINGTVEEIEATAATTVAGSGAIDKITAKANITVDATAVKEVEVNGTADVTVNANVPKITVADGAETTITVKDGVTVATIDTKENVIIDGSGKVDNVTVTADDVTTVTVNGTATVTTVESTGSANVTVDGTSENKPEAAKKVETVAVELTKTAYNYGEELDLSTIKVTVTYDNETTKVVDGTDTAVKVSGYNKETEGEQTLTISYAGVNATGAEIKVTVAMTNAQIFEAVKKELAADANVTKLIAEAGLTAESEEITLPLTKTVGNGHEVTITWTSDNEAVAIAKETGAVTITQPNGADITANVTATLSYTPTEAEEAVTDTYAVQAKVLGVAKLSKVVITAPEGVENGVKVGTTTEAFTVTAYDQHGEEFLVDETTWDLSGKESADTKFNNEDASEIKTLTIGADETATELTVTATAKKDDVSVTSEPIVIKVLQVSKATTVEITSKHTTVEQGGKLEFTGVVKDQYGKEMSSEAITWEVSKANGNVAEGTEFTGSVLTVAETEPVGELIITAKCGDDIKATTNITVTQKEENTNVESVKITGALNGGHISNSSSVGIIVTGTNLNSNVIVGLVDKEADEVEVQKTLDDSGDSNSQTVYLDVKDEGSYYVCYKTNENEGWTLAQKEFFVKGAKYTNKVTVENGNAIELNVYNTETYFNSNITKDDLYVVKNPEGEAQILSADEYDLDIVKTDAQTNASYVYVKLNGADVAGDYVVLAKSSTFVGEAVTNTTEFEAFPCAVGIVISNDKDAIFFEAINYDNSSYPLTENNVKLFSDGTFIDLSENNVKVFQERGCILNLEGNKTYTVVIHNKELGIKSIKSAKVILTELKENQNTLFIENASIDDVLVFDVYLNEYQVGDDVFLNTGKDNQDKDYTVLWIGDNTAPNNIVQGTMRSGTANAINNIVLEINKSTGGSFISEDIKEYIYVFTEDDGYLTVNSASVTNTTSSVQQVTVGTDETITSGKTYYVFAKDTAFENGTPVNFSVDFE